MGQRPKWLGPPDFDIDDEIVIPGPRPESTMTTSAPTLTTTPDAHDDFYEILDGVRVEIPAMGAYENILATLLAGWLNEFARPRKIGLAVTEVLFRLDGDSLSRRPDVAFVTYDRWNANDVARENAWDVIPNLAVEIVSRTNFAEEIERKMLEYFSAGVQLVWVIYPEVKRVYAYSSPTHVRPIGVTDVLDGGEVLPGFRLPLADLFAATSRPENRSPAE